MELLKPGDPALEFSARSQEGECVSLASLAGQRFILYFYPRDNTPGCTLEARSLRDGREALARMGLRVIGVSGDSERSHASFCARNELGFTLLSDPDHRMAEAYGVWREKRIGARRGMGIVRTTFIIDARGRIERVFDEVTPASHAQQIIEAYQNHI